MNKLLVICGPTATGKTALGIKFAKKYHGEILSADSRQVYQGMDIGTGKDIGKAKFKMQNLKLKFKIKNFQIGYYLVKKIPIWLLDVVKPDYKFSVADYVKCAQTVIKDIWQRGKLPILVGGTGFYIKGLINGYESLGIKPDWELRKHLGSWTARQLGSYLKDLDPKRWRGMNRSDRRNPRRLIRAVEVAMANRKLATRNHREVHRITEQIDMLMVGLKMDYRQLYQRIDKRIEERVKQGIVEEIKELLKKGYSWENSVLGTTIGYQEWRNYFMKALKHENSKTKLRKEVIQKWQFSEHAYARRQMTWFKKDPRLKWFDINKKSWQDRIERLVNKWYSNH